MRDVVSPRSILRVVAAGALLLLTVSCSGAKAPDQTKLTTPEKAAADPELAKLLKEIDESTATLARDPKSLDERGELAYVKRGRAHAKKADLEKALADYDEGIQLYPEIKTPYWGPRLLEALFARGGLYVKKGDLDKAIADYTRIIEAGSRNSKDVFEVLALSGFAAKALVERAKCYDQKGDRAKANADYVEAIRLAPELLNTEEFKARMGN